MFAPHCPRCAARVLLGPRRLVTIHGRVAVRCHCGTLLDWDQQPEHRADASAPAQAAS